MADTRKYVVMFTSPVIEAADGDEAIARAGEFKGGGHWEAIRVAREEGVLSRIASRLERMADEAFDPREAIDSDGTDQARRAGLLDALDIVRMEFERGT